MILYHRGENMETIKNYLEAMFANLPNTPEVKKAKAELFSMMEDKYSELIADGLSENAAVGTVISEFGNLDELAEDLGLTKEVEETHAREEKQPRRFVRMDEIQEFLSSSKLNALLIGLATFFCIICVTFPIMAENLASLDEDRFGVLGMFICIGIGVAIFVFCGVRNGEWDFLKKELCQVDMATAEMVKEKKNSYKLTHAILLTVGVLLCSFCWLPCVIVDFELVAVSLFLCVGIGVLLIIYTNMVMSSYETVLKLNDSQTISGSYGLDKNQKYINKSAEAIMEVFWPTITCIYLIISFVTFNWGITWIIWPIGAVIHKILEIGLVEEEE